MFPLHKLNLTLRFQPRRFLPFWVILALLLTLNPTLAAESLPPTSSSEDGISPLELYIPEEPVFTDHETIIGSRKVAFRAEAGRMPLFDLKTQTEQGQIFYVAYTANAAETPSNRPLTFVFNGGPGSPSIWLHMGALGPFRAPVADDGLKLPRPPYSVEPNPFSLLDQTDLVFIDPVGTGFSRATPEEEGNKPEGRAFWGVMEDVDAVAEFIRMYLTRADRWASPFYLAGESYGGMR